MSTRPERLAQGQSAHPDNHTSAAPSSSNPRHGSLYVENATSALRECVVAISLVQVTVHSLESQDIGCSEQDVLNRAIEALWSVHDWIHEQMWPDTAAERGSDRECHS